jgi:hypothetical protein
MTNDKAARNSGEARAEAEVEAEAVDRRPGSALRAWLRRYRRSLITIALTVAALYTLGHFAKPVNCAGMCLVYR